MSLRILTLIPAKPPDENMIFSQIIGTGENAAAFHQDKAEKVESSCAQSSQAQGESVPVVPWNGLTLFEN